MKEITAQRYHDILYKFFVTVACLGLFILAMDLIAFANQRPLYFAGQPVIGDYAVIPLILDGVMILGCSIMSRVHKKHCMGFKWR